MTSQTTLDNRDDAQIERVARAICRREHPHYTPVQIDHAWGAYKEHAQDAIAAIHGSPSETEGTNMNTDEVGAWIDDFVAEVRKLGGVLLTQDAWEYVGDSNLPETDPAEAAHDWINYVHKRPIQYLEPKTSTPND